MRGRLRHAGWLGHWRGNRHGDGAAVAWRLCVLLLA